LWVVWPSVFACYFRYLTFALYFGRMNRWHLSTQFLAAFPSLVIAFPSLFLSLLSLPNHKRHACKMCSRPGNVSVCNISAPRDIYSVPPARNPSHLGSSAGNFAASSSLADMPSARIGRREACEAGQDSGNKDCTSYSRCKAKAGIERALLLTNEMTVSSAL